MGNEQNKTELSFEERNNQLMLDVFQKVYTEAEHAMSFMTAACLAQYSQIWGSNHYF